MNDQQIGQEIQAKGLTAPQWQRGVNLRTKKPNAGAQASHDSALLGGDGEAVAQDEYAEGQEAE